MTLQSYIYAYLVFFRLVMVRISSGSLDETVT